MYYVSICHDAFVPSSPVNQMPSLCWFASVSGRHNSILYSAVAGYALFTIVEIQGIVTVYVSLTTACLTNNQHLYFSRQTSWDNDDFSHWGEIKARRGDSAGLLKKNTVWSTTSHQLELHFNLYFSLLLGCARQSTTEGTKHTPRTDLHFFPIKLRALQLFNSFKLGS